MDKFCDRREAGRFLAPYLTSYRHHPDVVLFALPRGGVPVAYEIAKSLNVPLDVFIVRKLGLPWHNELAMGAIASGNTIIFNENVLSETQISESEIDHVIQNEKKELQQREARYRHNRPFPSLKNKIVILVDDGIATGATIRVAINALYQHSIQKMVVAVPVAPKDTFDVIAKEVDEIICPLTPTAFRAVGEWYENFSQTTDEEVLDLLAKSKNPN